MAVGFGVEKIGNHRYKRVLRTSKAYLHELKMFINQTSFRKHILIFFKPEEFREYFGSVYFQVFTLLAATIWPEMAAAVK